MMTDDPTMILKAANGHAEMPVAPLKLGERVREIRKARNWTLEEAAKRAGLARSTLSKIENEQMSPTFDAVQKLARGLGIGVPQLFTPSTSDRALARRSVTRKGMGVPHPTPTYDHMLLAPEISRKRMLPYKTYVQARSFDDFEGWVRHEGEEFLFVLGGRIRFYSEFYEPVDLGVCDSVYYDAGMGHNVISLTERPAEILWVTAV